jgi:hydrogenase maturation protein HypF
VAQARAVVEEAPFDAAGLTGGVFQDRRLAEAAVAGLVAAGWQVFLPEALPANDSGLAFGQIVERGARDHG